MSMCVFHKRWRIQTRKFVSKQARATFAHAKENVTIVQQMDNEPKFVLDQNNHSREQRQKEETPRSQRLLKFRK